MGMLQRSPIPCQAGVCDGIRGSCGFHAYVMLTADPAQFPLDRWLANASMTATTSHL